MEEKEKFGSISDLMRARLKRDVNTPYGKLSVEVKRLFPKSKYNIRHWSWYRSAVRNNRAD